MDSVYTHELSSSLLYHEVGGVLRAGPILVIDAGAVLPHLEQLQGVDVDTVVEERLHRRADCGTRWIPVSVNRVLEYHVTATEIRVKIQQPTENPPKNPTSQESDQNEKYKQQG